jgi:hypothetical protein
MFQGRASAVTQGGERADPGPQEHADHSGAAADHGPESPRHHALDGVEALEQTIEHEIETIEHEIMEIASTPPRLLFLHAVYRELPYIAMLSFALLGVGYVSFSGQSMQDYWVLLAPLFGAICVVGGWHGAETRKDRIKLLWTQALHWSAVVVAMNIVYLPSVRSVANNNAAGLTLMTILALATFLAGVHAAAWQICVVGAFLAIAVPAIAWIEQSSLFIVLLVIGLIFVGGTLWWTFHSEKSAKAKAA